MKPQRCLLLILAAAILGAAQPRNAETALGAARHLEEAEGNYPAAIEAYKKVLAQYGKDRALAARALVRMGRCYEKLGDTEARKAYERVVREFSDQAESADSARERLAALTRALKPASPGGVIQRLVWSGPTWGWGGVSPDGRWIAFQNQQGDLAIRDIVTGENRLLTNYGPKGQRSGMTGGGVFSPDGKRVAFVWMPYKTGAEEIRVVNMDGTGERVLYHHDNALISLSLAWTPDATAVVAGARLNDAARQQILRIAVSDGSVEILRTHKRFGSVRTMSFSLSGRFLAYSFVGRMYALDLQSPEGRETSATLGDATYGSKLLGWPPDGQHILFLSGRSGTQDAWILPVKDGRPAGDPRLVKSGLATADYGIYTGNNDIIPMGFTRTGACYYGTSRADTEIKTIVLDPASGRLDGPPAQLDDFFTGSPFSLQWSPDGNWAICQRGEVLLVRKLNSRVRWELRPRSDADFENAKWHPDGKSLIIVDGGWPRGVLQVDLETGATKPLVRDMTDSEAKTWALQGTKDLYCLTHRAVLSSDGKTLYRSMFERKGASAVGGRVVARDLSAGEEKVIHHTRQDETSVFDLALSPDGTHLATLDSAYPRARIHVFPVTGEDPASPPLYSSREDSGEDFAAITWSPDGKSLLAGVNRSGTTGELRRIPLDGGPHQTYPLPFMILDLHPHPDGRRIGITAWKQVTEVWALENFLPGEAAGR